MTPTGVADLDGRPVEVLVIGGGILGAGVAMELASRGRSCLLVEQRDFGQGTTSRSTRLIHGGLRYLALYDFGLVREGLRERAWQAHELPHLVRPLPFLLPHYRQSRSLRMKVGIGMTLYDLLSPRGSFPRHRRLAPDEVARLEPDLTTIGLQGAELYWDGQVELPERLVIEVLRRAVEGGAVARNHVAAVGLQRRGRHVSAVELLDMRTGERAVVPAEAVVNASGPWVDDTLRALGIDRLPLLRLTQGVHLIYPRLGEHAVAFPHPADQRLCFAIPWLGATMVGTTDTDVEGSPEAARIREEDVSYLAQGVEYHYAGAAAAVPYAAQVGVRALPRLPGLPHSISRRHILADHRANDARGLFTLAGGKLTAWRAIARHVVSRLEPLLSGAPRRRSEPASWGPPPDGNGGSVPPRLWRLYGPRASELGEWIDADPWWGEPIVPGSEALRAEVPHAFAREWSATLADVVARRLALAFGRDLGHEAAVAVADICRARLGWTDDRVAAELRDFEAQSQDRRLPASAQPGAT